MTNELPNFSFHDIPQEKIAQGNLSKEEKAVIGKHLAANKDNTTYKNFFKAFNFNNDPSLPTEKKWDLYAISYSKYLRASPEHARETALFYSTEAHTKGRSPSYIFDLAKQLVGIPLNDKLYNHEKSLFLVKFINNPTIVHQLHSQSRTNPIIADALSRIAANFDSWDHTPPSEELKNVQKIQLKNLVALSNLLQSLAPDKNILREVTMTDVKNSRTPNPLSSFLKPYLNGEKNLESADLADLERQLKPIIQAQVEASRQEPSKPTQKIRESSIKALADLHNRTVESKAALAAAQQKAKIGHANEKHMNEELKKLGIPLKISDFQMDQPLSDFVAPYLNGEKKFTSESLTKFQVALEQFFDNTDIAAFNIKILNIRAPITSAELDKINLTNPVLKNMLEPIIDGSKFLNSDKLVVIAQEMTKMGFKVPSDRSYYAETSVPPVRVTGVTGSGAVYQIRTMSNAKIAYENEQLINDHLKKRGIPVKISDLPMNKTLSNVVAPYLSGEKRFNENEVETLNSALEHFLNNASMREINIAILDRRLPISLSGYENIKLNNPPLLEKLTPIFEGAKLLTSSLLSELIPEFEKMGIPFPSEQDYYTEAPLPADKPQEVAAGFFKQGTKGDSDTSKFETFAYRVADLIGLGNSFTGTKMTTLQAQNITVNAKNALEYRPEIAPEDEIEGSIQNPNQGDNLYAYLNNPQRWKEIQTPELNRALLASATFGMFDQNPTNVIVTPVTVVENGVARTVMTPKFFDNTRSLPNGASGFIRHGDRAFSTTRCSLLAHPATNEDLKPGELQDLQKQVEELIREVDENLEPFMLGELKVPGKDKTLNFVPEFPTGWLDKKGALSAMKIRLNNIDRALKAGKIVKPRDITFAADPSFKFVCALTMVATPEFLIQIDAPMSAERLAKLKQLVETRAGYDDLEKLLSQCADQAIDPKVVYDMCNSPMSIDDIFAYMMTECRQRKINLADPKRVAAVDLSTATLRRTLMEAATPDFKDIKLENIQYNKLGMITEDCRWAFIDLNQVDETKLEQQFKDMNTYGLFFTYDNDLNLTLHFKVAEGQILHSAVDYTSQPGKIKLLAPELTNLGFNSVIGLKEKLVPPFYVGVHSTNSAMKMLDDAPPYTFLVYTEEMTNQLFVLQKVQFGVLPQKALLPTDKPGIYEMYGRQLNLGRIEEFMGAQKPPFKPFQNQ